VPLDDDFKLQPEDPTWPPGSDRGGYPVRPPAYDMAVAPKEAGIITREQSWPQLALMTNPHNDSAAAEHFNSSAYRLWEPLVDLQEIYEASSTTPALDAPKSPLGRRGSSPVAWPKRTR
jgi:hypothetical protein